MTAVIEHDKLDDVIKQMKSQMTNDEVWEQFREWGERSENDMRAVAEQKFEYDEYGTTFAAMPGTCQRVQGHLHTKTFLMGYQFSIDYEFYDQEDKLLGQDRRVCFLADGDDGKIAEFYEAFEFSDFTPTTKLN